MPSKQVSLMNPIEKLVAGFEIFLNYDGESGNRAWDSDELHAGDTPPANMVPCDAIRLKALGWMWNEGEGCWSIFQ